jgi:hypothetical protein
MLRQVDAYFNQMPNEFFPAAIFHATIKREPVRK